MKPICFDTCSHAYRIMGDVVAKAFSVGKELVTKNLPPRTVVAGVPAKAIKQI